MRVQLVRVLRGIQANVFAPHNLMYIQRESRVVKRRHITELIFDMDWIHYAAPLSSPEPGSSAAGLGEEETPCLQVQTMRLL